MPTRNHIVIKSEKPQTGLTPDEQGQLPSGGVHRKQVSEQRLGMKNVCEGRNQPPFMVSTVYVCTCGVHTRVCVCVCVCVCKKQLIKKLYMNGYMFM